MNFNSHGERAVSWTPAARPMMLIDAVQMASRRVGDWPPSQLYFRLMLGARLEISFQFVWFVEVIMTDLSKGWARLPAAGRVVGRSRGHDPTAASYPALPSPDRNKGFRREQKNGVLMLFL